MGYLVSGLNIKNISDYDSSQSYDKYSVVDFQLNTNYSAYPGYTGLGGVSGLNFWFNNEYLSNFKLDGSNFITGWQNSAFLSLTDNLDFGQLIQSSEEENARPFVDFNEDYINLKNQEFLSGSGINADTKTLFICFEAMPRENFEAQPIVYMDRESGTYKIENTASGPSGLLQVKGENVLGSAKFTIDEEEFTAVCPIYDQPNIITLVQYGNDEVSHASGPMMYLRQNGIRLPKTYEKFYSGWTSGFMEVGRNSNPDGMKYYDLFSFSGVLDESEIENYEKYLFESYFNNDGLYFAKKDVPVGPSRAPISFTGVDFWTQKIDELFNLTYGSSVQFSSKLSSIDFGDGYKSTLSRNVNSLNSTFDLKYEGLSDIEAKALVAFFENTPEAPSKSQYETYKGVNMDLFEPYKKNAEIYFLDIDHQVPYNDVNNITIKGESLYDSNLDYKGMLVELDESKIRTYSDSLKGFDYNDVVYIDSASFYKRGYYFYTGEKTSSALAQSKGPLGDDSSFTRDFYFKEDIDYDISSNLRLYSSDMDGATNQYEKNGLYYNRLELDLTFSNRSNKESLAILKFLDSNAGFKTFNYTLPQPYNKKMLFYCPEWSHTYNFLNNNDIQVKLIHFSDFKSLNSPTIFNTKINFTS